ncbi:hypothetical protein PN467_19945, partial [Microcystis aeruginosa CS-563/04]|uniref:hypothetical protein n=1 Tax=Microcystis aeruginosa TaxID=1126 RepID=UPI00232B1CB2
PDNCSPNTAKISLTPDSPLTPFFDSWKFAPISNGKGLDFAGGLRYAFLIMGIRAKFLKTHKFPL